MTAWLEPSEQVAARLLQVEIDLEAAKKTGDARREQELKQEKRYLTEERQRMAPLKKEWENKKGDFEARKAWLDRMTNRLEDRTRLLANRADRSFERVRMNQRVGTWTDDYSNLLSVFNWGR